MTDRALSFGAVAAQYDQYRPGYPREVVRWALDAAPGKRVVDLGAGTGKLTAVLRDEGASVVAVDPDPAMLAQLVVAVPGVAARRGAAEAIPLDDGSADLAIAAQAFHWFDPARALPEIARVLVLGGVIAVVWNVRDEDVAWVAALSELIEPIDGSHHAPPPDDIAHGIFAGSPTFGVVETASFAHEQPLDVDGLVALVCTRSHVVAMSPTDREALSSRVRALCASHPDLAGRTSFAMPYLARAFRAIRG